MLKEQLDEMHKLLVAMCPDHAGIEATHLGRFRVKVVATARDGHVSTIVLALEDDFAPTNWARQFAKQLHQEITT